jgi:1-phosphofructokinase family hexose kinase
MALVNGILTPKIITVTANSAMDYVIEVNHLALGDNVIAQNTQKFAAGKGINVAKAVAALNCPVQTLGFVGTESAALFQKLNSNFIHTDFTAVIGETRTNISLADKHNHQETHIRTAGFSVTKTDCQRLLDNLTELIQKDDIVVLSGSLPKGAAPDFYKTLISVCYANNALPFLDSSGTALERGLQGKPYLIKPNQDEFETLIGCRLETEQDMIAAARAVIAYGVTWVVISRAAQGALLVGDGLVLSASVKLGTKAKIISHIGCGDALLAGLAVAKLHNYHIVEILKLAVACGTANLFSTEPGHFSAPKLAQIMKKVQIQVL